jgi:5-methylcytosine-specific restriction endonuclease McrA
MNYCPFPGCSRIADKSGMCIGHRIYKDSFPVAIIKEQIKGIAKVSDKRKELNKELAKVVKQLLKDYPECQIKSPSCTIKSVTANHIQKRSPKNLTDRNNLEACCAECNSYVEHFPLWAKENGHHKMR